MRAVLCILTFLTLLPAAGAIAQTCPVDSVAIRVDQSVVPYERYVDAFDAGAQLIWSHPVDQVRVEAVFISAGADRVYALSPEDRVIELDCAGNLIGTWPFADPADYHAWRLHPGDGTLDYATANRSFSGVEVHDHLLPLDDLPQFATDRAAYETWSRALDGTSAPFDTERVTHLGFGEGVVEMRTEKYDDISWMYFAPVDYRFDLATGALEGFPWVHGFELLDGATAVALDADGGVLWTRGLDAPGLLAIRMGERKPWEGGVVVTETSTMPPRLIRFDFGGNEIEQVVLGPPTPDPAVVKFLPGAHISYFPSNPHMGSFTGYHPIVVSDPVETRTVVHTFYAGSQRLSSQTFGSMRTRDALKFQGAFIMAGYHATYGALLMIQDPWGDGSVYWLAKPDAYEALPDDEVMLALIDPLDPDRFEAILASGRSRWFGGIGEVDRLGSCLVHDVDGDAFVDEPDLALVLAHLGGQLTLDTDASCRADTDLDGAITVADAVRIEDRIAWTLGAPLPDPGPGPGTTGWAVSSAALQGDLLKVRLQFVSETGMRALAFRADAGGMPTSVLGTPPARTTPPSSPTGLVTVLWDSTCTSAELQITFAASAVDGDPGSLAMDEVGVVFGDRSLGILDGGVVDLLPLSLPGDAPPARFRVDAPRPNPFNPSTHLDFQLDRRQSIVVEVFETGGRRVRTLADGPWPAGTHRIEWDGRDDAAERVATGVYFIRFRADEFQRTWKATLLK